MAKLQDMAGVAGAEQKETAVPDDRPGDGAGQGPGFFGRVNARLQDWAFRAPIPMGVASTILAGELKDFVVDPGIRWSAGKIRNLAGTFTAGAAEQAKSNLAQEAEHNLFRGVAAGAKAAGQVFASESVKETSKNALAGVVGGLLSGGGAIFR